MRKSTLPFVAVLFLWAVVLQAQETRFFVPREIKQAYDNGTRSYDGKPGAKYWHNTVDYTIEVEVIPDKKRIKGSERVIYTNNSPNVINEIVIRLYHDAFRKANERSTRVQSSDITEGVEINKLVIGGKSYDTSNRRAVRRQGTNLRVTLQEALPAGKTLELEVDWAQYIPETTIRTGAYDSTSFFMAYWYPQIAVYDDLFGWDLLRYDFGAEFYNNLGNYDVKITAPNNYAVLSTGVLQNVADILDGGMLERYKKAQKANETVSIIGPKELEKGLQFKRNTWHYVASEVPDFAFCMSDHYYWDATSQQVDGRDVLVSTFYPDAMAESCQEVTANQRKMMKHFSEDVPGIPYPYPAFTTFIAQGGGGMEYPMMANNGGPGLGVTVHEMFHTYFPMYVRVNEKRFAWMDEGWADFVTAIVENRYFRNDDTPVFRTLANQIQGTQGTISDLPLITSTQFMDDTNYGYASYPLPSFVYSIIHQYLGEEVFMKCYREYIRRWAQKSPTPYDFFYTFEDVSGQQLEWIWKPWFFEYGSVDVAIDGYTKGKLSIKNLENRPVPLTIAIAYNDGTTTEIVENAKIWGKENSYVTKIPNAKAVKTISVNADIPDVNQLNNFYPPLRDRYDEQSLPVHLVGRYQFNEFPSIARVLIENGLPKLVVDAVGFESYLAPTGENEFESLDGTVQMQFEVEGGEAKGFKVQTPQFNLTANKL